MELYQGPMDERESAEWLSTILFLFSLHRHQFPQTASNLNGLSEVL
ncbi:hypothetical protein [Ureibacillus aquaedulcis]|uniref:PH domain-containing protein n=1 Tax=Ureibacillus aquaedulcis TaxID=3058421 RepID=A0ABT8GTQ9_9BACL|nr:hypothetical protein [Ureibacillus sp. BA0131]MDN4494782.1 hypothetical protein [Ureibacillus sp. BA0131]